MVVKPTLDHETEYYVDVGTPNRQNTQGLYTILAGPNCPASIVGDVVVCWTIAFWVEVVEANQAQSTGAAIGEELAMIPVNSTGAVNMNTLSPIALGGGAAVPWGGGIDQIVSGSAPGVALNTPTASPTTSILIQTSQPATYVFVQQLGDSTGLSAALASTYNLVAQANTTTLLNTIQGFSTTVLGLHVWSQGSTLSYGQRQIGYSTSGAVTFQWGSAGNSTKRTWIFKMPNFTSVKPRTEADAMERRVFDKINRMMMSSSWVGPIMNPHDNTVASAPVAHDEKGAPLSVEQLNEVAKMYSQRVITPASVPKDGWVKIPIEPVVVPTKRTPTPNRSGGGPSGS